MAIETRDGIVGLREWANWGVVVSPGPWRKRRRRK